MRATRTARTGFCFLGLILIAALALALTASPLRADGSASKHGEWKTTSHDHDDDDDDEEEGKEEGQAGSGGLETVGPRARGTPRIRYVPGELLVRFRPATSDAEKEAATARAGGRLANHLPELGVHVVEVSPARTAQALASLRSEPSVASVERDVILEGLDTVPNDALWSTQWGSRLVGAPRAWDTSRGASGVVIAVLDTGVDARHPDLAGATVAGRDIVNDDADASDDNGHGTGAAGVIAARTNNREGQAGVCWACSLMPVKVLDSSGAGKTSTLAGGIVWAVDHGARVLNMSLGGPGTSFALESAVGYASRKGAVLVASAGNSGVDTRFYPAAYGEVIGVAATTESDTRYSWSNFGDWVQVAAPGCNTAPSPGGGYVEFCGTSSAGPIVAGIAGLALALRPGASKSDVEQAIAQSATPTPGVSRFGRVNAPVVMNAVAAGSLTPLQPPPPSPPSPPPPPSASQPPSPPPPPPAAAPVDPPARPANTQPPRLRGLARVGRRIRVLPGAWSGTPTRINITWRRCARNGARCRTIAGARTASYRIRIRDRRHRLRALVVAVNAAGATSAVTAASSVVRVPARR